MPMTCTCGPKGTILEVTILSSENVPVQIDAADVAWYV